MSAEEKIVDYKLCKRLDELGFESESHTGWWVFIGVQTFSGVFIDPFWTDIKDDGSMENVFIIKAYDCYDLLSYLSDKDMDKNYLGNGFMFNGQWILEYWDRLGNSIGVDKQPQNALAKAVIKILEEQ